MNEPDTSRTMSSIRVAIVTDDEHPGLRRDDLGLDAAFRELGAELITVPWLFYGADPSSCKEKCDGIKRFGDEVIAKLSA